MTHDIHSIATRAAKGQLSSERTQRLVFNIAKWEVQGYEPGFNASHRSKFTQALSDEIQKIVFKTISIAGIPVRKVPRSKEWCDKMAETIVTGFLSHEKIKFGNSRFDWNSVDRLITVSKGYLENLE